MWDLAAELRGIEAAGLYRRPRVLEPAGAVEVVHEGRRCLVFCSNDYLGLAADPRLTAAFTAAAKRYGVGSGAAHLVTGHRQEHELLEQELAAFLGRDRVLLFSTGYMANMGVIDALVGSGDAVFQDRLNHASLLDGGRLSGARQLRYRHNDPAHLEQRLQSLPARRRLIVTDGVFSMDGDVAPLPELAALAEAHDALLMVDDAHGLGVLADGRGSPALYGLEQAQLPLLVGTLGKGVGTFGAFAAGPAELIEYLIQRARTYVFTTAPPPAEAAATRAALALLRGEPWRREHLLQLIRRFRRGAEQLGLPLMNSQTPIQPLLVGSAEAAVACSEQLLAEGLLVTAIRPPTVPQGASRLRITLSAAHTEAQVDRLLSALEGLRPVLAATNG